MLLAVEPEDRGHSVGPEGAAALREHISQGRAIRQRVSPPHGRGYRLTISLDIDVGHVFRRQPHLAQIDFIVARGALVAPLRLAFERQPGICERFCDVGPKVEFALTTGNRDTPEDAANRAERDAALIAEPA